MFEKGSEKKSSEEKSEKKNAKAEKFGGELGRGKFGG